MAPHYGPRFVARSRERTRGGVIIGVLFFLLIISIMLMGIATLAVSHQNLEDSDSKYSAAMDLAEAGINYEFRKISQDVTTADQYPGTSYSLGGGTFKVYCTNQNGSTPWAVSSTLYVVATGTLGGVSRTIKVSAIGGATTANYALFGMTSGSINGTAAQVNGDVGTNGWMNFNGHPTINGQVVFNGPGSNWQAPPNGTYNTQHNSSAVNWPTVNTVANQQFPNGGLAWLAQAGNNDNSLSVPPITGNMILLNGNGSLTFKGKPGGANYYLTSLTCNGNTKINFDNSAGPINIWMGPSGSSGTFVFSGGTAAVKMSADATKAVKMYVATTNDVIFNGNTELDAGVYDYNGTGANKVIFNGTPTVYGSFISNAFILNGNPTINYQPGYFTGGGPGYYGYNNSWVELNPR